LTGNLAEINTRNTLMNSIDPQTIGAREVTECERMQMLPKHFGRDMLTVEYAIFAFMHKISQQYSGGYWIY
jgi:hypothetical protein